MRNPAVPVRSRRWPLFVPFGILVVLAGLWCGAWFYLAAQAQDRLADWRAREADAGRVYGCGTQTIGGFPFRIELNCADPSAQFTRVTPSFAVKSANTLFAWQVYQPNLVIGEFTGPLVLGELGRPASLRADWHLADASIRIATTGLERVSVVFEQPTVDRGVPDSGLFTAQHAELHGRPSAEASADKPAIDVVLRLVSATAPALHPLTARPFDAEINGVLRGAVETTPKPWPVLLREWQARGGSLQIDQARVQQDDIVATGTGTLALTARGGLNGRMQVTVVGLDKILQALGLDQVVAQGDVGSALNALDRLLPGLGQVARQNAGASIVAGLGALGQGAQLEGKPAVTVPLRFDDGAVTLGPFLLGRVPPLF